MPTQNIVAMKLIITCAFLLFLNVFSYAQNGLEKVIVEKYYISDEKDAEAFGGKLPVGSVTYRVFVDMLPRYKFQAVYGIPTHQLRITTSTLFFNNEDKGAVLPNVIPAHNLKDNTVMLDSWISVGAAAEGNYGVLKSDDNGFETIVNANGVLQNNNNAAGIPLTKQDGLLPGIAPRVTIFGIDSLIKIFDKRTIGAELITSNGSWASLYGSMGPDSLGNNRVLIGQFTTDGDFSFELNIQIGSPFGSVENYVAKNPQGLEKLMPELIYFSSKDKEKIVKGGAKAKSK